MSRETDEPVTLVSEPDAPPHDRDVVSRGLDEFNMRATGQTEWQDVVLFLRREDRRILGGLVGYVWGGWLHITHLWVDETLRGRGFGRRLVEEAEGRALAAGADHSCLSTYSFQARPFYERLGYEVYAALPGYPRGHTHYHLRKSLGDRSSGTAARPGSDPAGGRDPD